MKKILFLFFILFISPVFGVVYDTNITGACGVYENLNAKFSPIQYTCDSGYFLPANAISCAACPSGFSCPGGTYTFNETKNSGLNLSGTITQNITNACDVNFTTLKAVYTISQYTCSAGQYLPANAIECTSCPTNSSCPGGTYTFNETADNGIQCNSGYSYVATSGDVLAHCDANTIIITYGDSGDSGSCTYGETFTVPSTIPTKRGHVFTGWIFE